MRANMISVAEYKKQYIDRQGKAPAILMNKDGATLSLGDVHSVTKSRGRIKMQWKGITPPDEWTCFTHVALMGDGEVQVLEEVSPINFEGKSRNVVITFYE